MTAIEMVDLLRQLPKRRSQTQAPSGTARVLRLVLPKGSLEQATLELFEAADLAVSRGSRRRLPGDHRRPPGRRGPHPAAPGDPPLRGRGPVRPRHHRAGLDRGDGERVVSLGELHYSKATARPIKVVLAVAGDSPVPVGRRPPRRGAGGDRVPGADRPVSWPSHGIEADVLLSYGATEAKIPEIADAVVEITETGRALRAAGLRIVETILVSYTELIANPAPAHEDPEKRHAMEPAPHPAAGHAGGPGPGAGQAQRGRGRPRRGHRPAAGA